MKKIAILGIRRSGNSPIRNWIADQFDNPKIFLNSTPDKLFQEYNEDVVISLEEMPVEIFNEGEYTKVLILRDPPNLFATRTKHYDLLSSKKRYIAPQVSSLWVNHARKFIDHNDIIPVNHQFFLRDLEYRKKISKKLGGNFSDKTLDFVDDNGQGSSFDGLKYNGNARSMPVFDRWKNYQDLDCFRNLFTEEIKELSLKIFGENEKWKILYS